MAGTKFIKAGKTNAPHEKPPGIYPQPGFQSKALATAADIAILGGAAGAGKSFVLLMEASRHQFNPDFEAVIFRRTYPQIMSAGGLWDTAGKLYPNVGARGRENNTDYTFRSGSRVSFRHLQHEGSIYDWQGSQVPMIGFDELTHFTERQFWYMLTRNRSACGVRPYVRATCNPEPDSWVASLIEWYIDQQEFLPDGATPNPNYGFPIPERAGVLRYFTRDGENIVWGDSPDEVRQRAPHLFVGPLADVPPKSFTFIPGKIWDNQALLTVDPGYLGNLMAQDEATRAQLLDGNWKIKIDGLALFDYARINDLFTNFPPAEARPLRCITCDAAGFGRDLCVIKVWVGWEVVDIVVQRKSENREIFEAIEQLRRRWNVAASDVLIDQDGVGGGVLKLATYNGFSGGAQALADPVTGVREAYANLKTQCYYRFAERVNRGEVKYSITNDNVLIDGVRTKQLKMGGKVVTVIDLLKADLRAVKRRNPDSEGKKQINTKEEQKIILGGRSPDFGDTGMMREWFELRPVAVQGFMRRRN
ncbi:terminase family protein [Hymenobacter sp. 15J16-1T3B]|uniref:terminase large subunit domain-containing protein n=1 Tax=Hymenobacter sp. 15J16-1T3B TaxID=2886941 RepID=UPI001D11814E|nr:terminase family protein [Hymenobacter sp. 15J16-1T3B]MCC3156446.1 terminase family protein [Hymenobacter sp. 15J16-1T3B]